MKAVASCSVLQQNAPFGLAGMCVPRAAGGEEWKGGKRDKQWFSSFAQEGAQRLLLMGWRHVSWLQPLSFPL